MLHASLEAAGYEVVTANDSSRIGQVDAAVVGLDPAQPSRWDVVEGIRAGSDLPVVVLSPNDEKDSLQRALDLRVDGFLVQPVRADDVVERLDAALRRGTRQDDNDLVYEQDGLVIDWRSCQVAMDGRPVELTGTEFRLLRYLFDRRGWVVSHDQILSEVWGPEYAGERDRVKLYVWYLRQKIEQEPAKPRRILTKRGLGYAFAG
jgi:two-component system KDP operon response regulator KdpE